MSGSPSTDLCNTTWFTRGITYRFHNGVAVFSKFIAQWTLMLTKNSVDLMMDLSIDDLPIRIERVPVDKTLPLRHSVLWPDMPLSHVRLLEDDFGIHYGAFLEDDAEPVAVISFFLEDLPIDKAMEPDETNMITSLQCPGRAVRFRKFACASQYQGKGIGTQLLLHALSMSRSEGGAIVAWCDARTSNMEWYRKRGLHPFGTPFYKGRVEYIRMFLDLRDTGKNEKESLIAGS